MSFDENELRRALEARSGEVSPEYRARLGRAVAGAPPAGGSSWMAAIAVVVVTVLAATSVGVLLAARNARHLGPIASGPRVATPTPTGKIPAGPNVFVSAPSRDAVWLLIDYTHLYLSTDRGDHWVSRPLPPDLGIKPSISFIDASEGWLLAPGSPTTECQEAHAEIWHTTDAGTSWHQLAAAGLADAQCKEAIYFPDAKHGFVSAWDDLHQPSVYATSDGGLSWRKSTLPDGPL